MDRFLLDQNIMLYRRLRNSSTGVTERRAMLTLLADLMDDFQKSLKGHQQDKLATESVKRKSKPVKRWH